uniref:LOW QUALITY PROTEIN: uncharacterized protein LOC103789653 n=1 Tax=Callithrix jacchus TaxID=9483 RepID=UPI0023DD45E9|nr:LOW QUALITY PROTEIN: uncharacterized protein LOC103789653 [Callithrix jacchus]
MQPWLSEHAALLTGSSIHSSGLMCHAILGASIERGMEGLGTAGGETGISYNRTIDGTSQVTPRKTEPGSSAQVPMPKQNLLRPAGSKSLGTPVYYCWCPHTVATVGIPFMLAHEADAGQLEMMNGGFSSHGSRRTDCVPINEVIPMAQQWLFTLSWGCIQQRTSHPPKREALASLERHFPEEPRIFRDQHGTAAQTPWRPAGRPVAALPPRHAPSGRDSCGHHLFLALSCRFSFLSTEQRRPRRFLPLWASRSSSDRGARLCGGCTTRPEAFEATLGLGGWAGLAPCNYRARRLRARLGRPSGDSHSRHQLQRGAPRLWSPDPSRSAAPGRAQVSPHWGSASSRQGEGAVLLRMLRRRVPALRSRATALGHATTPPAGVWEKAALFQNGKRKQEGTGCTGFCCRPELSLACGGKLSPPFLKKVILIQTQELW